MLWQAIYQRGRLVANALLAMYRGIINVRRAPKGTGPGSWLEADLADGVSFQPTG
jgi:hypothetical protein